MDEKMDKQYVITKDEMHEIWNAGHSMDLDTLYRMVFTLPALPVAPDVDNHCVCTFDIEDQGHQLEECDYHKALYARYEKRIGVIRMNYDICLAELAQEEEEHKQHHTEIDSLRTDITKLEEEQDLHIDLIDADHEKEIDSLRTENEKYKEALDDTIEDLTWIGNNAGRDEFVETMAEVHRHASSRADVAVIARIALTPQEPDTCNHIKNLILNLRMKLTFSRPQI